MKLSLLFFIYFFPNVCIASCNHTALGPLCCFILCQPSGVFVVGTVTWLFVLSLFFSPSLQAKNNTGWVWVSNNPTPKQKQLAQLFLPLPACIAMLVDLVTLGGRGGGKGGPECKSKNKQSDPSLSLLSLFTAKIITNIPRVGNIPKRDIPPTSKLPELEHPKFDTQ